MNREIKFRIWLKEKKQMIQDVHICPEYGWLVMSDNDALEEICGRVSEKELIWMQYTGIKDKNGVEVYEGDVVRIVYDNIEHIYQIIFDKEELDFKATNGEINYGGNFQYLGCCEEIEVIGNIYE